MQQPRMQAMLLFMDLVTFHGDNMERWPALSSTLNVEARAALPYSLRQLSEWLARGGMAQGAPAP